MSLSGTQTSRRAEQLRRRGDDMNEKARNGYCSLKRTQPASPCRRLRLRLRAPHQGDTTFAFIRRARLAPGAAIHSSSLTHLVVAVARDTFRVQSSHNPTPAAPATVHEVSGQRDSKEGAANSCTCRFDSDCSQGELPAQERMTSASRTAGCCDVLRCITCAMERGRLPACLPT